MMCRSKHVRSILAETASYMRVQERIFHVVIVQAASFLCTDFLTLLVTNILRNFVDNWIVLSSTPYIGFLMLCNSIDTIFISAWKDIAFRDAAMQKVRTCKKKMDFCSLCCRSKGTI